MTDKITLQPVSMRIPTTRGIYQPSKLRPKKTIPYKEFLERYADYPIKMLVCFNDTTDYDTVNREAVVTTAYGYGLDVWYAIVD